jgi:2-keto-4-pentenoate hydratase
MAGGYEALAVDRIMPSRSEAAMAMSGEDELRGMAAQLAVRSARLQAGDAPLGWKMGFGAPAAMLKLGLEFPLLGFLTRNAVLPSNATVDLESYTRAVAEPEIAVHMGADLGANASEETVRSAIAGLGPAIELVDLSFPAEDVERILAGNIYQRNLILGPVDTTRAGARLDGLSLQLSKDDSLVAQTTDVEANTGKIVRLIGGVADRLAELGLKLSAGDVVITGTIVPALFVDKPCMISYKLDPFDAIAVRFGVGIADPPQ